MDLELDDEELLAAIATGDEAASTILIDRYALPLVTEARLMGARGCVTDVANEVIKRVLEDPRDALEHGFMTWAVTVMEQEIERFEGQRLDTLTSSMLVSTAPSPSQEVVQNENLEVLQAAARALSDDEWRTLELVHLEGRSSAEAALELGVEPSTIRARMSRIRRRLLKFFQADEPS